MTLQSIPSTPELSSDCSEPYHHSWVQAATGETATDIWCPQSRSEFRSPSHA